MIAGFFDDLLGGFLGPAAVEIGDVVGAPGEGDLAGFGQAEAPWRRRFLEMGKAILAAANGGLSTVGSCRIEPTAAEADALSALANLGFRPAEASAAVGAAADELGEGATLDALVRLALRKAAK